MTTQELPAGASYKRASACCTQPSQRATAALPSPASSAHAPHPPQATISWTSTHTFPHPTPSHTFPHLPPAACMHAHVCPRDQNHFSHMWPRACCCCMHAGPRSGGGGGADGQHATTAAAGKMATAATGKIWRPQPLEKWRPQPQLVARATAAAGKMATSAARCSDAAGRRAWCAGLFGCLRQRGLPLGAALEVRVVLPEDLGELLVGHLLVLVAHEGA